MNSSYESAKKVALGLWREPPISAGDDLWSISLGAENMLMAEMPFQFFERGFEAPDAQTAQKTALMLYETEYAADAADAQKNYDVLKKALVGKNALALGQLLTAQPLQGWLSLIFLDGRVLKEELIPLLHSTDDACRMAFAKASDAALKQLVEFRDLIEVLRSHC